MEILPIIVLLGLLTAITLIGHGCGVLVAFAIRQLGGPLLLRRSVFLLLAIVTMIYYASVNVGWTWMGYVAGS